MQADSCTGEHGCFAALGKIKLTEATGSEQRETALCRRSTLSGFGTKVELLPATSRASCQGHSIRTGTCHVRRGWGKLKMDHFVHYLVTICANLVPC